MRKRIFQKRICILLTAILVLFTMVVPDLRVRADSVSISLSSSSVNIGDTVTATVTVPSGYTATVSINYPSGMLSLTSSSSGGGTVANLGDASPDGRTGTFSFKAVGAGNDSISVTVTKAGNSEGDLVELGGASASVTVANSAGGSGGGTNEGGNGNEGNATASADNSLASLTLSAGTLSPAFVYNTTNYTATVDYNVTSIAISATPSNANATIESVSGNENLAVGENNIKIVVKAENGVTATYTIIVTRKSGEEQIEDDPEADSEEPSGVSGIFEVNGKKMVPAETIPEAVIPEDFSEETVSFGGQDYPGLSFRNGNLILLYLVDENGENGALYVYDQAQSAVYPFVKLASEKGYVVVLLPDVNEIPEGCLEQTLSIEGKGVVTAYQKADSDAEPSEEDSTGTQDSESGETGFLDFFAPEQIFAAEPERSDFYLLYCMNQQGECGWYQYDAAEGTYQRYVADMLTDGGIPEDYEQLQSDFREMAKDLEKLENRNRLLICAFIFVIAFFVIVIVNLLLGRRRMRQEEDGEAYEDDELYEDEERITDVIRAEEENRAGTEADDEVEVEFYEMEMSADDDEAEVEFYEMEMPADDDEAEVEFSEMEMRADDDEIEAESLEVGADSEKKEADVLPYPEIVSKEAEDFHAKEKEPVDAGEIQETEEAPNMRKISDIRNSLEKELAKAQDAAKKEEDDDEDLEFIDLSDL